MNLADKMVSALPEETGKLIKKIGALSGSLGFKAYVVGGFVRDLLLGIGHPDIDIAIEGDAIKAGRLLAARLKTSIITHSSFGTCSVRTKYGLKIDLASARKESYSKPGALPKVEFSSLKDDLSRRDFTINAMAVSIDKPTFGKLIDLFDGVADLKRGRVTILHDRAFIDDPTRILRAVRFKTRLGFAIDQHTAALIKSAMRRSVFDTVSRERLRDQLILSLSEREPVKVLKRMAGLGLLKLIHPGIKFDKITIRACGGIADLCAEYDHSTRYKKVPDKWLVYLMVLSEDLTYSQVSDICREFVFKGSDSRRLLLYKKNAVAVTLALKSAKGLSPSGIHRLLMPMPTEALLAIMARVAVTRSGPASRLIRHRIEAFLQKDSEAELSMNGDDLKAMGLKGGPGFKSILDTVLRAKIDGKLKNRADELKYACALIDNSS